MIPPHTKLTKSNYCKLKQKQINFFYIYIVKGMRNVWSICFISHKNEIARTSFYLKNTASTAAFSFLAPFSWKYSKTESCLFVRHLSFSLWTLLQLPQGRISQYIIYKNPQWDFIRKCANGNLLIQCLFNVQIVITVPTLLIAHILLIMLACTHCFTIFPQPL